ncbi:uncharacterized protein G2W53_011435 [Senna tora]|uniref:Uncharacterized protein n=1 Tax=Senna tora TaxID=362788 RepID=A0A835CAM5_9FABA|nr:uncharacterized protein G2W53_011435 [Senna tora]
MASSSSCVFEGFEISEATNVLLMNLMEEDEEYVGDQDRLVSMIQSLEEEIRSSSNFSTTHLGQVEDQDCSTSSVVPAFHDDECYNWVDMEEEMVSSSSSSSSSSILTFDDDDDDDDDFKMMNNAWISPNSVAMSSHDSAHYSEFCYGGFNVEHQMMHVVN